MPDTFASEKPIYHNNGVVPRRQQRCDKAPSFQVIFERPASVAV